MRCLVCEIESLVRIDHALLHVSVVVKSKIERREERSVERMNAYTYGEEESNSIDLHNDTNSRIVEATYTHTDKHTMKKRRYSKRKRMNSKNEFHHE